MVESSTTGHACSGRRIYIHDESLDHLARTSEDIAYRVVGVQCSSQARKTLHHHLDIAIELRQVEPELAGRAWAAIDHLTMGSFTRLLREVGFRPKSERRRFDRVLKQYENIAGTCYEAGYYTFATDQASAARMYADHERLGALRGKVNDGQGPPDLTIITGQSMALIRPDLGVGADAGAAYRPFIKACDVEPERLREIRREVGERLGTDLRRRLVGGLVAETELEEKVVVEAVDAVHRALRRRQRCEPAVGACGARAEAPS